MYPPIDESLIIPEMEMTPEEMDGQVPPVGDIPADSQEAAAEGEEESSETPEEVKSALKSMIDEFERIEQPTRDRMIRYWKKFDLFFKGIQNIYWDWSARDYRVLGDNSGFDSGPEGNLDFYYQDKIVNIFRAHAESVISALSQDVPTVIFPPDDAENAEDLQTSKGYTKASELLMKCNDVDLMMMYCIFILWNQGTVGGYNYNLQSADFGTYPEPVYENQEVGVDKEYSCEICGGPIPQEMVMDEAAPIQCPHCGNATIPFPTKETPIMEEVYVGDKEVAKKREKFEFYGPLNFQVPHYVTNPKHTPYIILDTECHIDYARELFPNLEITEEHDLEKYDRWARVSTDYQGELPQGLVTLRRVWLRPWTYNRFKKNDPETYEYLKAVYPEGAKVTLINDKIAKCEPEILDDHWTFTQSPLSSHIHAEPIGAPLAPIQELRNELVVLKLQTIEYGIPETFADPSIFDFEKYEEHKASPGAIYPVKQANAGQPLESSFVTLKTATYPKEATDFQKELDADGQFVTGAFPSIYGGSMPSASKTAAEYQMSRNQALQRLQTTWKVVSRFWAKMMDKSVRSFVANMTQDERFTVKKGKSYINVYIRQSELKGRVGQAEPEIANTFPLSWMQKRDVLLELMQLNNEFINEALFHPENTGLLSQYMGFKDFYIPGDDDRTKQLLEIQALLETEPMEIPPAAPTMENPEPQPILQSTIPVDPEMDKHQIEYETCTAWMVSEVGLDAKETNPAGYANVRAHASEHLYFWQMQQQAEMEAEAQQENANGSKGSKKDGDGSEQKAFSKSGKE